MANDLLPQKYYLDINDMSEVSAEFRCADLLQTRLPFET